MREKNTAGAPGPTAEPQPWAAGLAAAARRAARLLADAALGPALDHVDRLLSFLPPRADAAAPTHRLRIAVERWLSSRGQLQRRERVPPWFWAVVVFHMLLGAIMLLHPVVFPREYDGWLWLMLACIAVHWLVCCGECIVSVVEKKLFYSDYTIGTFPLHQWYMDVFSARGCVLIACCICVSWLVCVLTLVTRNFQVDWARGSAAWHLMFAGIGVELVVGGQAGAQAVALSLGVHAQPLAQTRPRLFSHW